MYYNDFKDIKLSGLGMGCMRFPVIDSDEAKIDQDAVQEMVDYAMAHGINYFDTAWGYHNGNSEISIGKALAKYDRDSYYLATKFPGYDLKNFGKHEEIFNNQLEKCGTDHFDFYLYHNVCEENIDKYLNDDEGLTDFLLKMKEEGKIKYDDDFFGKMTSLTVSGQLEGELGATALGQIYTFGPTFRAENSNTPRHLAEFWMIEPEVAFIGLDELMDLEEDFIKHCVKWALEHCKDDLEFLNKMIDKTLIARLESVIKEDFVRLPYTEGIKILEEAVANGHKFEFPVSWGMDLASEHERYLVEHHFKKPVIMINYPKDIKAFYMKMNEDGKTVQGTDVLFPQIGEIIGGSVREENYDKLMGEINRRNIPMKDMWWYLDTRKYGTCPHGGFGLGFERLILFVTGMANIRDVIPFPRTPNNAEF